MLRGDDEAEGNEESRESDGNGGGYGLENW